MNQTYRLDKDFEIIGTWILPGENFSKGTTGKLAFYNGRLKLEVYGNLNRNEDNRGIVYIDDKLGYEENIFGFSQDGFTILLNINHQIKYRQNSPGFDYSEYLVGKCLLMKVNYAHFEYTLESLLQYIIDIGINNIECTSLQFSFKGINNWMDSTVIRKKTKEKGISIFYDFEGFENDVFELPKYNIQFTNSVICQTTNNSIYEEYFWKLNAIDDLKYTLDKYLHYMHSFKDLVHLFVESPTEYTFVDIDIAFEGKYRNSIKSYYIYEQYKAEKDPNITITYNEIKDKFSIMLENWFEKNNRLNLIIDNYLNDINTNYFSDSKLLNSIKNLEIYHRNFIDISDSLSPNEKLEEQKKLLKSFVVEHLDREFQDRFISNIDYSPETSLSKRLTELFNKLNENMKEKFFKEKNKNIKQSIKSVVYSLVQTRNYLTHGDYKSKDKKIISDTEDQLNITSILNQIIKYYIFYELDILDDHVIDNLIKQRKVYG
ncbi:HEPN domain-containing protein [Facklamia miroungae]|uniref:Apea-like HEPN domain-containing protein n=1 Tax=Facklamia miroungae TaxID=120956 RepID=A0A1G7TAX8_9LACT|nr:HEPN domain-containing protein [Facklamia miroungae]NKZ29747.1 hypothetical protein [Facklamia miroungae]SDG32517.1 hypothetical protein SAMN05421791_10575 [Facklamia miroungae]